MRSSIFVFVSLVAADGVFDEPMNHYQIKREILQPRQSIPNLSPSCTSALLGIYNSIPTPPARLITAIGAENGNPCSVTVPSSLSSDYSSYESKLGSWYSESSNDVSSALSSCPELSSLATLLPVCVTSFLGGGGGAASGSGTNTASGASNTDTSSSSGGGASNTDTSSGSGGGGANSQTTDGGGSSATGASATGTDAGAAPRETGFAIAALAVAGAVAAAL